MRKATISRAIAGASLEVIQKKRAEKPEVRQAARDSALREVKERMKKDKERFQKSLTLSSVPVRAVLGSALKLTEHIRREDVEVDIALPPNLPFAFVDERRLSQIFINLLSNAFKHTHSGCVRIIATHDRQEHIGSVQQEGRGPSPELDGVLRICVEDTGIGIAEEKIPSI